MQAVGGEVNNDGQSAHSFSPLYACLFSVRFTVQSTTQVVYESASECTAGKAAVTVDGHAPVLPKGEVACCSGYREELGVIETQAIRILQSLFPFTLGCLCLLPS